MRLPERIVSPVSSKLSGLFRSAPGGPRRVAPAAPIDLDATLPLAAQAPPEAREVLEMKCLHCLAPVERGTAPVRLSRNGVHLSWPEVPAWVCTRCSRAYFEPAEVEKVRGALHSLARVAK